MNNNRPLLHHEWKSGLFAKGSERKDADAECGSVLCTGKK